MQYDTATVIAAVNDVLGVHAPGKRIDCPNEVGYNEHGCCKDNQTEWTCPYYPGTEQEAPSVFRLFVQPDPKNHPSHVKEHIQDNSFGACYCNAAAARLHQGQS